MLCFEKIENHTKKKSVSYKEQDPKKVEAYLQTIQSIDKDSLVYIDETSIDRYWFRQYAYAKRGKQVKERIYGKRYARTSIVAAQNGKNILAPLQYSGTMDHFLFENWFSYQLLPNLPDRSCIILDNAAFHRKKALYTIVDKTNHTLLFLPPYSPQLNPIEKFWAKLKHNLHSYASFFPNLSELLLFCFNFT